MTKISLLYLAILSALTSTALAQNTAVRQPENNAVENYSLQQEHQALKKTVEQKQQNAALQQKNDDVIRYTGKQLKENPAILERLFVESLIKLNKPILPVLVKLYEQVPTRDRSLIEWANAILLADKHLSEGISAYKALIQRFPNNNFIRFQYANALFYNKNYYEANQQFHTLLNNSDIKQDNEVYQHYLDQIDELHAWNFYVQGNFLNDRNLGQTAKPGTVWTLPDDRQLIYKSERQHGQGLSLSLNTDKKWFLPQGQYLLFNSGLSSKYYWNNKKYNEMTFDAGMGYGYANEKLDISLQPYFSKRFYGGGLNGGDALKQYSDTYGGLISFSYWLTNALKYGAYYNYGYTHYNDSYNRANEGRSHYITNSLTYFPDNTQYWNVALDYGIKDAKEDTESYHRKAIRFGWGKQWQNGLITNASVGYADKQHKEALFFDIRQRDKELTSMLSFGHSALSYKGFTPKLTWTHTRVKSNYTIYQYNKNDVFINISKSF
ncbi:DUF560 domain-containing protein [Pasteurellaceae bacterium HPA106]|uniref:surface lipoprotein assembly modifier n=1 Tax=Spirabiliibacterium pneumoniae TaxID=221400 RepID=UPI001AAC4637|nr:surface lipoprotein assembly modifier [Spirabiliibacterium pneumoniae]MBE2896041.1 DUF560 domain-containing protein [Spirabiliibacterium pneumoniae]